MVPCFVDYADAHFFSYVILLDIILHFFISGHL